MRELTKSINTFSWAMALFGLEQASRLLVPRTGRGLQTANRSFESVGRAAEDELAGAWRRSFNAVDDLQRGAVDATFDLFRLDGRRVVRGASDVVQRSVRMTRQILTPWV